MIIFSPSIPTKSYFRSLHFGRVPVVHQRRGHDTGVSLVLTCRTTFLHLTKIVCLATASQRRNKRRHGSPLAHDVQISHGSLVPWLLHTQPQVRLLHNYSRAHQARSKNSIAMQGTHVRNKRRRHTTSPTNYTK